MHQGSQLGYRVRYGCDVSEAAIFGGKRPPFTSATWRPRLHGSPSTPHPTPDCSCSPAKQCPRHPTQSYSTDVLPQASGLPAPASRITVRAHAAAVTAMMGAMPTASWNDVDIDGEVSSRTFDA